MELLFILTAVFVGLVVLDVLAITFGVDSRDQIRDDWAR
jgi:hypothetical protein